MGGKTTQETSVPEPSYEEKTLMQQVTAMLPMFMSEAGYDVSSKDEVYESSPKGKQFATQRQDLIAEKQKFEKEHPAGGNYSYSDVGKYSEINKKIETLDKDETAYKSSWVPGKVYDVRKLDSPAVEAARKKLTDKYGDISDAELDKKIKSETASYARKAMIARQNKKPLPPKPAILDDPDIASYKKEKETYTGTQIEQDTKKTELMNTFMEKTKKYLDGDFSITDEQKSLIKENMAPIRASVEKLFEDSMTAADQTATDQRKVIGESDKAMRGEVDKTSKNLFDSVQKTFDEFESRIKETGMSMLQGLDAVGAQVQQTGLDMEGALKNTVAANKELLKLGIEDYTGEITKKVAMNAARMGRSPDDPEYTNDIATSVAKQVKEGTLNLTAMEAQGMIGIKERTGAGLEDVAKARVGVAERTGGQLEQSSLSRGSANTDIFGRAGAANEQIANRTAMAQEGVQSQLSGTREELIRARGTARIGLDEGEANQRWQVGAGMPPSQIGVAQGALSYNQALATERMANAQVGMQAPMGIAGYYQQNRMANPTTTQSYSPGFGDYLNGFIGVAGATAKIVGAAG